MALAGVGVDILEISRMERALERTPRIRERVFTEDERAWCDRAARPAERYAARWAAREAVLKALGIGFSAGVGLKDVSVGRDDSGRPVALLRGRAAEVAHERGVREVALSLSHTYELAVANAVAVTDAARPKRDAAPDPKARMQASFREARAVIDELERVQQTETGVVTGMPVARDDGDPAEGVAGEK